MAWSQNQFGVDTTTILPLLLEVTFKRNRSKTNYANECGSITNASCPFLLLISHHSVDVRLLRKNLVRDLAAIIIVYFPHAWHPILSHWVSKL